MQVRHTSTSAAPSHTTPASPDTAAPDAVGAAAPSDSPPTLDPSLLGAPMDAATAGAVLATGGSYLQGAQATLARLDDGIEKRSRELENLQHLDPAEAIRKREQLDLLQRLRDRIQLSVERVTDILAGTERPDIGGPEPLEGAGGRGPAGLVDEFEQRRQLLAPGPASYGPGGAAVVAGAYARGATA